MARRGGFNKKPLRIIVTHIIRRVDNGIAGFDGFAIFERSIQHNGSNFDFEPVRITLQKMMHILEAENLIVQGVMLRDGSLYLTRPSSDFACKNTKHQLISEGREAVFFREAFGKYWSVTERGTVRFLNMDQLLDGGYIENKKIYCPYDLYEKAEYFLATLEKDVAKHNKINDALKLSDARAGIAGFCKLKTEVRTGENGDLNDWLTLTGIDISSVTGDRAYVSCPAELDAVSVRLQSVVEDMHYIFDFSKCVNLKKFDFHVYSMIIDTLILPPSISADKFIGDLQLSSVRNLKNIINLEKMTFGKVTIDSCTDIETLNIHLDTSGNYHKYLKIVNCKSLKSLKIADVCKSYGAYYSYSIEDNDALETIDMSECIGLPSIRDNKNLREAKLNINKVGQCIYNCPNLETLILGGTVGYDGEYYSSAYKEEGCNLCVNCSVSKLLELNFDIKGRMDIPIDFNLGIPETIVNNTCLPDEKVFTDSALRKIKRCREDADFNTFCNICSTHFGNMDSDYIVVDNSRVVRSSPKIPKAIDMGNRIAREYYNNKTLILPSRISAIHELRDDTIETLVIEGPLDIGSRGLADCYNLTTIKGMENIRTLGSYALVGTKIQEFKFGSGVTEVLHGCLAFCPDLQNVELHEGIQRIKDFAFFGSKNFKLSGKLSKNVIIDRYAVSTTRLLCGLTPQECEDATFKIENGYKLTANYFINRVEKYFDTTLFEALAKYVKTDSFYYNKERYRKDSKYEKAVDKFLNATFLSSFLCKDHNTSAVFNCLGLKNSSDLQAILISYKKCYTACRQAINYGFIPKDVEDALVKLKLLE